MGDNKKVELIDNVFLDMRRDSVDVSSIVNIDEKTNSLIEKITNEFDEKMRINNNSVTSKQQVKFANDIATLLVNPLIDSNKTVIIPAKAGFGKSTIIKIATKNIIKKKVTFGNLNGIIIASDKIVNLKTYYDAIGEEYCYLIDSKSDSPIKTQFIEQYNKPILLISTQRLKLMGDNIKVFGEYKNKKLDKICKRTMLIIDEKPELLDSQLIDQKFISDIRNSIDNIRIGKDKVVDINNKEQLKELFKELDNTFIQLTKDYSDKEFYVHKADGREITSNDQLLEELVNKYLDYDIINKILHLKRLVKEQGGLWYNKIYLGSNHQFFRTLGIMNYSNEFKTLIFDATAEIDLEYHDHDKYIFLKVDDNKIYDYVNLYNYSDVHFGKASLTVDFGNNKPVGNFVNFINNNFKDLNGQIYLTTFNQAARGLKSKLKDKDVSRHIVLDDKGFIPHYGGTKGQNNWDKCNTAIFLGIYTQTEDIYTTMAVSYYFLKSFDVLEPKELTEILKYTEKGYTVSRLNLFRLTKMVVDLEQDIYRCAIRNFNANDPVNIYTFGLDKVGVKVFEKEANEYFWYSLLDKIKKRIRDVNVIDCKTPEELDKVLNHGNGDSIIANLIKWIREYDGTPMLVNDFKNKFKISQKYFEKIFSKSPTDISIREFQQLWKEKNIQKKANKEFGKGKWIFI